MTELTEIDSAHAAMEAAPEDDALRLRFYERLADSEVFLLLESEAVGDQISPASFEMGDQSFVLLFDRIERLAEFAGEAAPYAGLSGRGLAAMMAGQGIGWAVNPEVAPSSILIPAEAVDWLAGTLAEAPDLVEARVRALVAPAGVPEVLLSALDRKLAASGGLAQSAYLVGAEFENGARGHLVVFVDALDGAENALAAAVNEMLTFSGVEAGQIDVLCVKGSDRVAAQAAKVGLRFDLPQPEAQQTPGANPGMNPDKPPKLR